MLEEEAAIHTVRDCPFAGEWNCVLSTMPLDLAKARGEVVEK